MDGLIVSSKLFIGVSRGIVEVEGDATFVRQIYSDIRQGLLGEGGLMREGLKTNTTTDRGKKPKNVKSRSRGLKVSESADSERMDADSPKLDKDIDTSGLAAYYSRFEPRNHSEKILVFLRFLTDELGIESPNTNQVFTCYRKVSERLPRAFQQAFRTANSRHGYIEYRSPADIAVTTAGMNHFDHDLKRS